MKAKVSETKSDKKDVREKIVRTAVKLLGESGIRKLAQPQIAKKAGVAQGHMTYYFPTRSDLLIAVAERSLEEIAGSVLKNAAASKEDKTGHSLSLLLPLLKDKSRTRMMIGLLVESDENPALKKKLQEQSDMAKALISLVVEKKPDSAEVELIHAAILGLGVQYHLNSDEGKLAQSLQLLAKKMKGK
jgi:DNA-binding transcriptional regulator YbjK